MQPPILAECPVNIECRVTQKLRLPSHTLFIGEVLAIHANVDILDSRGEVSFDLAGGGLPYRSGPVREQPVYNFRPDDVLQRPHQWRDAK